jgi:hypothetical protein
MTLRKFGTGEILPEEGDVQKTATSEPREQVLAEVVKEQEQADKEDE